MRVYSLSFLSVRGYAAERAVNGRVSLCRAFDGMGCAKAAGVRPCQSATVPPGTHHCLWGVGCWATRCRGLPHAGLSASAAGLCPVSLLLCLRAHTTACGGWAAGLPDVGVCPTSVGVFRCSACSSASMSCLPHECGGVSRSAVMCAAGCGSAPRARGCFGASCA